MNKFEVSALVYLSLAVYLKVNGDMWLSGVFAALSILSTLVGVLGRER